MLGPRLGSDRCKFFTNKNRSNYLAARVAGDRSRDWFVPKATAGGSETSVSKKGAGDGEETGWRLVRIGNRDFLACS